MIGKVIHDLVAGIDKIVHQPWDSIAGDNQTTKNLSTTTYPLPRPEWPWYQTSSPQGLLFSRFPIFLSGTPSVYVKYERVEVWDSIVQIEG